MAERLTAETAERVFVRWFHGSIYAPYAATGHSTDPDNCWMCGEMAEQILASPEWAAHDQAVAAEALRLASEQMPATAYPRMWLVERADALQGDPNV